MKLAPKIGDIVIYCEAAPVEPRALIPTPPIDFPAIVYKIHTNVNIGYENRVVGLHIFKEYGISHVGFCLKGEAGEVNCWRFKD